MNAALIRGPRSLIFLLSYAALNRGRRFIGGGAFSSKYDTYILYIWYSTTRKIRSIKFDQNAPLKKKVLILLGQLSKIYWKILAR